MQDQIVPLCEMEDAHQVDWVAREHVLVGHHDTVVIDVKILSLAERAACARTESRHHPAEHRHGLRLAVFELGAKNSREIADVLCDQEIVLHESLDVPQSRTFGVAESHRDLTLDVERQALLGAPGEEVHVAADGPEEILTTAEQKIFTAIEHAFF